MKKLTGNNNNSTGFRWVLIMGTFIIHALTAHVYADDSVQAPSNMETVHSESTNIKTIDSVIASPETTASVASSVTKPTLPIAQKSSTASQLANLLGGLGLILLLIYGLSWFVKRFSQGGFMQNSTIKMLSAMPLGTRERLMLIDVGGKQMLLGVTATQINTLHVFDEPVMQVSEKANQSSPQAASDFSQKLMAILQQKNPGNTSASEHKNIK